MRVNVVAASAFVVAVVLSCAACTTVSTPDATDPGTSTGTASAGPTATATATASSDPSPSASASIRSDPNAPAGQCTDDALTVTVKENPEGSGAGQRESYVVFRNTGSSACRLEGFPGVSTVGDGNGTQIGRAAAKAGPLASTVTIAPGRAAVASLQYSYIDKNGGAYDTGTGSDPDPKCRAKPVDGYRVYAPHSFRAVFVRVADLYACSTTVQILYVSSVKPAAAFSLK